MRRIVPEQRPIAAGDGSVLLLHAVAQIEAVGDAVAVGEDEGRSVIGLGVAQRLDRLLRAAAQRDLRHVDVAIGDGLKRQILARRALAGGGELGRGAERRRLRGLAAGVGIDLGIEHQDVDVAILGEDVVEPAGADVVGPAVAADDPQAAAHQILGHRQEIARRPIRWVAKRAPQRVDPRALGDDLAVGALRRIENFVGELWPDALAQRPDQVPRHRGLLVDRETHAKTELGIVLEQAVVPGRAAPVGTGAPRQRREIAAIDRGAAGRVGDLQAVAEQLRQQLQIWRLAAAGAGAGEFEQRPHELQAARQMQIDLFPPVFRQRLEECEIAPPRLDQRQAFAEIDRLDARLERIMGRTMIDADAAAGAVLDCDLQA